MRKAATPGPINMKCRYCNDWGAPHLDCLDRARTTQGPLPETPLGRPWTGAGDDGYEAYWDQKLSERKEGR